jgi:hypothetical protein
MAHHRWTELQPSTQLLPCKSQRAQLRSRAWRTELKRGGVTSRRRSSLLRCSVIFHRCSSFSEPVPWSLRPPRAAARRQLGVMPRRAAAVRVPNGAAAPPRVGMCRAFVGQVWQQDGPTLAEHWVPSKHPSNALPCSAMRRRCRAWQQQWCVAVAAVVCVLLLPPAAHAMQSPAAARLQDVVCRHAALPTARCCRRASPENVQAPLWRQRRSTHAHAAPQS